VSDALADERCLLVPASCIAASALLLSMSAWCSPADTAAVHVAFRQRLEPVRVLRTPACALRLPLSYCGKP
jgi:hypothetical protein